MTDPATDLVHHPYRAPEGFDAAQTPTHRASSVFFASMADLRRRTWVDKTTYTYGLHGTPTTFVLEAQLATLEHAKHVILVPSGLSAITTIDTAFLKTGDTVLLPDNAYGPNKDFTRHELANWGIAHALYDQQDVASLAARLDDKVKLVWLEVPGSVTLEFPDLPALVRCIRERAPQAIVALDNTWGAGLAFNPFELEGGLTVDVTAHALTKYPSGGSDVLMGSIACRDDALYDTLAWTHGRLGLGVGPDDVSMVLRSLPSIALRYAAQDASCRQIATWLQGQPGVQRVLCPALPGSPGHAHWARLCTQAAGLLTIEFDARYTRDQVDAFVDALTRFRIGWSWGGAVSMVTVYQAARPRSTVLKSETADLRSLPTPYAGVLVRLCIGLEGTPDLIADLAQAWAQLPALAQA
ncbi:MAG: PLP-dependent transferase [Proteobacteria bacterium]|nr:PLP-dependent transferase [Pseudomonadota bacterium]